MSAYLVLVLKPKRNKKTVLYLMCLNVLLNMKCVYQTNDYLNFPELTPKSSCSLFCLNKKEFFNEHRTLRKC